VRIFLDANMLFSAAKSDGTMRGFLRQLRGYGHTLVADGYDVEETQRNLKMKFPQSLEDFKYPRRHLIVDQQHAFQIILRSCVN
jgi:hypothetical protein